MFQNWNNIEFSFESYFFLTNLSLKVQARMEDKVWIFLEKFGQVCMPESIDPQAAGL